MRKFAVPVVSALLLGGVDQATKVWAVRNLPLYEPREIVQGFFGLVHVRNTGVAFSLLSSLDHRWVHPFLILATVLAMGALLAYIAYLPCKGAAPVGLGLILGGAVGNLIDRARLGYVVDFLDLYWRNHHWPTFNMADVGISAGVVLLVIDMVFCPKESADAPRPRSDR
ncbi:MAG: signal peptidase II [Deltaproteobacteria bacterium RBG_16_66_15]|nr:MAG: signal peptidase II [Deltaproteobacteria bacterium GWA2_65_63]OGP25857.1 MAG: signal peptidase II [Deltaproteobacteria bacterium GWB2_65_81]OGP39656.1 MAG: signal peptidase II [Deltaproteobacteria bacterium GWC2_66_88]OGP78241.1 MAG: signal peptidase II [Deltaproteobacteria bacterium RBG_16_66_15]